MTGKDVWSVKLPTDLWRWAKRP